MFARSLLRTVPRGLVRFQSTVKINGAAAAFANSPVVKFTLEHEWVSIHPDGTSFVGITNHAADALGDATFIELPEDDIGSTIAAGDAVSSVESVKSASDIYSPIAGEILDVNKDLDEDPSLINKDPMGEGWIFKLKATAESGEDKLMTVEEYEKYVKESEH